MVTGIPVNPGDTIALYGTGFGPTSPTTPPGQIVQTPAPLANPAALTIVGVPADVFFAGLSATGLNQFNTTAPAVGNGDYEVIGTIAGIATQSGILLKVQG